MVKIGYYYPRRRCYFNPCCFFGYRPYRYGYGGYGPGYGYGYGFGPFATGVGLGLLFGFF